jgi:hypothetical protein
MASSGMLHCVALVRTDTSEELSVSFITVTTIGKLGMKLAAFLRSVPRLLVTANAVPISLIVVILMMEGLSSSETRFLQ